MCPDALHVSAPLWRSIKHSLTFWVKCCGLQQDIKKVPLGSTMHIHLGHLCGSHKPLIWASHFTHSFHNGDSLLNISVYFLFVLESCHSHAKAELENFFVELLHLESHLSSEYGIIRNKFFTLVWLSNLKAIVCNNLTFRDQLTRRYFEHRKETIVEIQVPLSFIVQADKNLLESNFLCSKSPSRSSHKWTQVMSIHPNVILVDRRLGFATTWPHESFQSIKFVSCVLFELLVVYCLSHLHKDIFSIFDKHNK